MADNIRILNEEGIREFSAYLASLRNGADSPAPTSLLIDGRTSDPFMQSISITRRDFATRYEFGIYLAKLLSSCDRRSISRNHGLWTWLALYFFDYLSPMDGSGKRKVLEDALYVLEPTFKFRRYYRHLVRTPWLAVEEHGEFAKVLVMVHGKGARSEFAEQVGAYQDLFANRSLIEAAYKLYFDPSTQQLRRGVSGKGSGSPRRFASVTRQLSLTYDLQDCSADQLLSLLPKEFRAFAISDDSKQLVARPIRPSRSQINGASPVAS